MVTSVSQAVAEALRLWRLKGRLPDLARPLLAWLIEATAAERAVFVTLRGDGSIERVRGSCDVDGESIQDAVQWISPHVIRKSLDARETCYFADTRRDRRFRTAIEQEVGVKIHSMLTLWLGDATSLKLGNVVGDETEPSNASAGRNADKNADKSTATDVSALIYLDSRFAQLTWPLVDDAALATLQDLFTLGLRHDALARRCNVAERRLRQRPVAAAPPAKAVAAPWTPPRVSTREADFHGFRTRSPTLIRAIDELRQLSTAGLAILIEGESGTGKEILARAIHTASGRDGFVSVHCGALPESLVELELFGHVQGAFTGADRDRTGLFGMASGGTIFLDDIGEMAGIMQNALLRVLQSGKYRPISGEHEVEVDVRIISSALVSDDSNLPLIERDLIRRDLHYRLAGATLVVPPLRERREDIALLLDIFRARYQEEPRPPLPTDLQEAFNNYEWPGNVRELENVVRRMCAMGADQFTAARFEEFTGAVVPHSSSAPEGSDMQSVVDRAEREAIIKALLESAGNKSRAAQLLGLSRKTLYRRMEKHGIPL